MSDNNTMGKPNGNKKSLSTKCKRCGNNTNDTIVNSVVEAFLTRSNVGIEKYGTTLDRDDLTPLEWLKHAQEEAMDFTLYLEKLKKIFADLKNETNQFNVKDVLGINKQLIFDLNKNDYVEYIGGSNSKYLTIGNKYRLIRKTDLRHHKLVIENDAKKRMITNFQFFKEIY